MMFDREKGTAASAPVRYLSKLLDAATRICLCLSAFSLFLLLAAYVFEVGARYFFDVPTSWSYDFSQWCLAVSIMTALPDVTRRKANISIDFLLTYLPLRPERMLRRAIFVLACVFCLAAAGVCFEESRRQYRQQIETNWINPIPKWWISLVIPVGLGLSGLQFLRLSGFRDSS